MVHWLCSSHFFKLGYFLPGGDMLVTHRLQAVWFLLLSCWQEEESLFLFLRLVSKALCSRCTCSSYRLKCDSQIVPALAEVLCWSGPPSSDLQTQCPDCEGGEDYSSLCLGLGRPTIGFQTAHFLPCPLPFCCCCCCCGPEGRHSFIKTVGRPLWGRTEGDIPLKQD